MLIKGYLCKQKKYWQISSAIADAHFELLGLMNAV